MHLCGGKIQDLNFFGKAESCAMEKKQVKASGCCENQQLVVQRLDAGSDTKIALHKASDLKFLATIKVVILQLFASGTEFEPAYAFYASPPLARGIPVLVQSFLL